MGSSKAIGRWGFRAVNSNESATRAFLYKPDWLFIDKATPALDETTEQALYATLRERLPQVTLISTAHCAGVVRFHGRCLTVRPETRWLLESPVSDSGDAEQSILARRTTL